MTADIDETCVRRTQADRAPLLLCDASASDVIVINCDWIVDRLNEHFGCYLQKQLLFVSYCYL